MGKFFGIFTNIWTSTQESGIVLHLLQRFQMKDILGSLEYARCQTMSNFAITKNRIIKKLLLTHLLNTQQVLQNDNSLFFTTDCLKVK